MKRKYFYILLFLTIFFTECNTTAYHFDISDSMAVDSKIIKDTNVLRKFIVSNDTISGFFFLYGRFNEALKRKGRRIFEPTFIKNSYSRFYLIDSIHLNDKIAYLLLDKTKNCMGEGYIKTLYLSVYSKDRKCLKTIIVAENSELGDGLVGGHANRKSILTKENKLIIYSNYSQFLDIDAQEQEDSIITIYDLNRLIKVKVDTIRHIGHVDF